MLILIKYIIEFPLPQTPNISSLSIVIINGSIYDETLEIVDPFSLKFLS